MVEDILNISCLGKGKGQDHLLIICMFVVVSEQYLPHLMKKRKGKLKRLSLNKYHIKITFSNKKSFFCISCVGLHVNVLSSQG